LGSGSVRLTAKPIEGLTLYASAINKHKTKNTGFNGDAYTLRGLETDNTAVNVAFAYTLPCFTKLTVFGQWTHDWDADWFTDRDADVFNAGIKYNFNEQWRFVLAGDYLRVKQGSNASFNNAVLGYGKTTAWAIWPAIQWTGPWGLSAEAGYRFDSGKYKVDGVAYQKIKGHNVYAKLGFSF
jgi:hypothetical protein